MAVSLAASLAAQPPLGLAPDATAPPPNVPVLPLILPEVQSGRLRGGTTLKEGAIGRSSFQPTTQPSIVLNPTAGAIAPLSALISKLEAEIAKLEAANAQKAQTVNGLVASIAARKAELQKLYEQKRTIGILGVLFGAPMLGVASLVMMQQDDAKLKTLNASLSVAQAERAEVKKKLATYGEARAQALGALDVLKGAEDGLSAAPTGLPGLSAAADQADRTRALASNLRSQIDILTGLKGKAQGLGLELDAVIAELSAALSLADKAVQESQKDVFDLIKAMVSKNPEAAARKLVFKMLTSKVKAQLESAVQKLLEDAQLSGPGADLLKKRMVDALMSGFNPRTPVDPADLEM